MRFLIVLALLLTACAPAASPSPTTHTISGTLALNGTTAYFLSGLQDGAECHGIGGYEDILAGAQVTVTDQASAIIGIGSLEVGAWHPDQSKTCTFPFTVDAVSAAAFYSIEVSHRGQVRFSAAEIESHDWKVALTLGQ